MKWVSVMLSVAVTGFFTCVFPEDFYIDASSKYANDSNPGTSEQPWKTIAKANSILRKGDIVFIKGGTYKEKIAPKNSGSPSAPITYVNFGEDSVTITDTYYGIHLNGRSYIKVKGFHFRYLDKFLWIEQNSNHNTILNCTFDHGRNIGWSGSKIYRSSSYNRIIRCRFSKYGKYTDDDIGSILDIGNEESTTDTSNFNLLDSCLMFHAGHHILGIYGKFNVIRNCYFHNENWLDGYGNRNVYFSGYPANSGNNLFENNRVGFSGIPPDNWGTSGFSLITANNIIRRNVFIHNNLSGLSMSLTSTYYSDITGNRIYNNTFFHNGFNMSTGPDAMTSAIGFAIYSGNHFIKDNKIINNIFYHQYQDFGYYRIEKTDQVYNNNWNGNKQGDPLFTFADTIIDNPMNPDIPDLHLQNKSPCIDKGVPLAVIVSPAGSGKTIRVDDAGYFFDGWEIEGLKGDIVKLFGTQQKAMIQKIDYDENLISLDVSLTWSDNQGLCLDYQGKSPDIGAFEWSGKTGVIIKRHGTDAVKNRSYYIEYPINKSKNKIAYFDLKGRQSGFKYSDLNDVVGIMIMYDKNSKSCSRLMLIK